MQHDADEDQPAAQCTSRAQLLAEHGGADHDDRDQLAIGDDRTGRGTQARHAIGLAYRGNGTGTDRREALSLAVGYRDDSRFSSCALTRPAD